MVLFKNRSIGSILSTISWAPWDTNNFKLNHVAGVGVETERQVRSIVHSHVGDLMFGGQEDDSIHHGLLEQLQHGLSGLAGRIDVSYNVVLRWFKMRTILLTSK